MTLVELAVEAAVISLVVFGVFEVFSGFLIGKQSMSAENDFRHTVRIMNDELIARIRRAQKLCILSTDCPNVISTAQAIYLIDSGGTNYSYQATTDSANPDLNLRLLRLTWDSTWSAVTARKFIEGADHFVSKDFYNVCAAVPGAPSPPYFMSPALKSALISLYNNPPSCPKNPPDVTINGGLSNTLSPGCYGNLNVKGGAVLTLSPGNYTFNDIKISGGSALVMNVSSTLCGNGQFCNSDGTTCNPNVVWYVNGKIEVSGGSGVNVNVTIKGNQIKSMSPAPSCYLYVLDYDDNLAVSGGSIFSGQVYSPNLEKFTISGGSTFSGQASIPGAKIRITGNSTAGNGNGNGSGNCPAGCTTGCIGSGCPNSPCTCTTSCYTITNQFMVVDMLISENLNRSQVTTNLNCGNSLLYPCFHTQTMVKARKEQ